MMNRPKIICHMLTSINGKISGGYMGSKYAVVGGEAYETTNDSYHSQAWLCGRVTMEKNFTDFHKPELKEIATPYPRTDYVAQANAEMYIVSADPSGKVGWTKNTVTYENRPEAHIIEILTDKASDAYVAYLREQQISYIFAGKDLIDCTLASEKLLALFGIKTLMVSGGGYINWSFLQEGLIDEVSIVMTPSTDGRTDTNTIFERADNLPEIAPVGFKLKSVEIIEEDTLWLRYGLDK
ncbi:dihydrofolate reductase family protein [Isobaculum melis]|uniref:Pyrimidine reductase, riboflavin biosynthesis n=1 Tax=Isobaculum melis TaxID=142588 RepID=A0A1H9T2H7_9LACT|nr:dihydrofolate reductase family protein [Isobaculum melis]SER91445.1 Pyrimidine reductase, riboflavin biosynthesis [Isobaculum melis]